MWTHKITSGTKEHPVPKDVLSTLLTRMIGKGVETSWAHFEVVAERGWFRNLLFGKEPWVEVALLDANFLELNLGIAKSKRTALPEIPEKWPQKSKLSLKVPIADRDELVRWIDACFCAVFKNSAYQVSGWLEGL